jgi:succinate dehydrogenase / fumarate reductase cytochrome b subunit
MRRENSIVKCLLGTYSVRMKAPGRHTSPSGIASRSDRHRNIHISQLVTYRLPAAGWVSILHRISGAGMFFLLPFAIWLFDASVTSEASYEQLTAALTVGIAGFPGWSMRLIAFALIWAYLLHFCAGLRHVWMDATHSVGIDFGRLSAIVTIAFSTLIAFALGAKLFL